MDYEKLDPCKGCPYFDPDDFICDSPIKNGRCPYDPVDMSTEN